MLTCCYLLIIVYLCWMIFVLFFSSLFYFRIIFGSMAICISTYMNNVIIQFYFVYYIVAHHKCIVDNWIIITNTNENKTKKFLVNKYIILLSIWLFLNLLSFFRCFILLFCVSFVFFHSFHFLYCFYYNCVVCKLLFLTLGISTLYVCEVFFDVELKEEKKNNCHQALIALFGCDDVSMIFSLFHFIIYSNFMFSSE